MSSGILKQVFDLCGGVVESRQLPEGGGMASEASLFFFFETECHSCHPGWSAMVRSQLTATSASWVKEILLPSASQVAGITGMSG